MVPEGDLGSRVGLTRGPRTEIQSEERRGEEKRGVLMGKYMEQQEEVSR